MSRRLLPVNEAQRNMRHAARDLAATLEAFALRRLRLMAKRNPSKVCGFASANGTWSFYLDGELRDDGPADRLFSAVREEWGYSAIPAPLALTIGDRKLTRRTNW